ncbi:lasso peptide biosynthesis PqqD family chaperone [Clostridium grantii]|uniref:Coenzyme PQQ synthesis protein D (PqqD) n=1 Tax=Clostridium grantii DSM 8605 TaxID=1121316 RepID=A0A1M5X7M6_9CLOT|nr:lasso peptide biosynthesis PqqD family chaperone [Clostridium grantii]SHH95223.1 Coenzyme PQQ synthesis protein D (PqqD) [Clostridium grantii DSM 8605]
MINISMNTIVEQREGIDTTDIDGEKAMMDLEKGQYFMLDSVGSRIWEIISKPCAVKQILLELMKEYDVDEKTCEEGTVEFLEKLNEDGLLVTK